MKYKLFAILSLLIPIIELVFIFNYKIDLEKKLILKNGILIESKKISRGARSSVIYKHKFKEYTQYLEGSYGGLGGLLTSKKVKAIYKDPPPGTISKDIYWLNPTLKDEKERKASFYTVSISQVSNTPISYLYLRLDSDPFNSITYQAEILQYTLHKQIGRLILFIVMIINLLFFTEAFRKFQWNRLYIATFFVVLFYHLTLVLY